MAVSCDDSRRVLKVLKSIRLQLDSGSVMPLGVSLSSGELRFLARNVVLGISHLNLGLASRLRRPTLEPVTPLSWPLPIVPLRIPGAADS